MLLDYAFHANPGAVARGSSPRDLPSIPSCRCSIPRTISPFSTFLRTLLTSGVITVLALIVCYPIAYYLAKVATREVAAHPDALPAGAVLGQRGAARLCLAHADGAAGTAEPAVRSRSASSPSSSSTTSCRSSTPTSRSSSAWSIPTSSSWSFRCSTPWRAWTATRSRRRAISALPGLGCTGRIVIPHAKPGIASGCIVMFMLCAGSFIVPVLLGGRSSFWFTQAIEVAVLRAELERRLGLCAGAGIGLPRIRDGDDARLPRHPARHRAVGGGHGQLRQPAEMVDPGLSGDLPRLSAVPARST